MKRTIRSVQKRADSRGFTLLVAVVFMSVMLAIGLGLGALAYKQEVLASSALGGQKAFYAADAALECVLYADQQQNLFNYANYNNGSTKIVTCGSNTFSVTQSPPSPTVLVSTVRISLNNSTQCADVTVYKPKLNTDTTYLFSQGYDISCTTLQSPANSRFSSRGLRASY